jgi:hypothetical protein
MVVDIRETETLLLKRSRSNLDALKKVLNHNDELQRVPAVLGAFSIAGIVASLFINASTNNGRLLTYHSETLAIFLKQLADESEEKTLALSALRCHEAGLLFPWLDNRIADIQTTLEWFQEVQMRGIAPQLSFINKITEVTRALAESPDGISSALRSYVKDKAAQVFIWSVVEELIECIDRYPDCLDKLHMSQHAAEDKMTSLMAEVNAFSENQQMPQAAVAVSIPAEQLSATVEKLQASILQHAAQIENMRASVLRFDKSLQVMAKTLPPFIRTLSNLSSTWNREANV